MFGKKRDKKCPVGKAFNHQGQVVNLWCGLWACKRCGKVNANLWAWRVRLQIVGDVGTDYYFWTLTMGSRYKTAKQGFQALPKLWDAFRKKAQRKLKDWLYCAFVEGQTKRGNMPHFHVISNRQAPERLKDMAVRAGFGFQAKEIKVNDKKAASYVSKYASKGNGDMPKGFRRVRASRKWASLPDYEGYPLLVKGRDELLSMYIIRVHDSTGVDIHTLYERWSLASEID